MALESSARRVATLVVATAVAVGLAASTASANYGQPGYLTNFGFTLDSSGTFGGVDVANGNFYYSAPFISQYDGLPSIQLFYNSLLGSTQSGLGAGWTLSAGSDVTFTAPGAATRQLVGPGEYQVSFVNGTPPPEFSAGSLDSSNPAQIDFGDGSSEVIGPTGVSRVMQPVPPGAPAVSANSVLTTTALGTRLTSLTATTESSSFEFQYTPSQEQLADFYTLVGTSRGSAIPIQYNAAGLFTSVGYAGSRPAIQGFQYDASGHLDSVDGGAESLVYDASGRVSSLTYTPATGQAITYTFSYVQPNPKTCATDDVSETDVTSSQAPQQVTKFCATAEGIVDHTGLSAELYAGQTLGSGQTLTAGGATLTMQAGGNLVLTGPGGSWSTDTGGNPGATLSVAASGDVQVLGAGGSLLWDSDTAGVAVPPLELDSDGTLAIYSSTDIPVWQTFPSTDNSGGFTASATQAFGPTTIAGEDEQVECADRADVAHFSVHEAQRGNQTINAVASLTCYRVVDGERVPGKAGLIAPSAASFQFKLTLNGVVKATKTVTFTKLKGYLEDQIDTPCVSGTWQNIVTFKASPPPGYGPFDISSETKKSLITTVDCQAGSTTIST